jgi:hypothetical protein
MSQERMTLARRDRASITAHHKTVRVIGATGSVGHLVVEEALRGIIATPMAQQEMA